MHDRYESLREAQQGTYEWILAPYDESQHEDKERRLCMDSFFRWYETGVGIYWISGKPGSGKSTLMKYLVEHIGSCETITQPSNPVVLSFFLWIGGESLQRSKIGCLKSLLCELLQNQTTQRVTVQNCRPYFKNAWSEKRLEAVLSATFKHLGDPVSLFIDGLDESKDHEEFLDFLNTLININNVKMCVSSRPEPVFVARLQGLPSMKLHELNSGDIQRFIKCSLLQDPRIAAMNSISGSHRQTNDMEALAAQIKKKSEGVFLWVYLVVKDLLKGISNKDNFETLSRRLELLPGDIQELYEDMLRRSGYDTTLYQEDLSLYLSLVLHRDFDLVEFSLAIDDNLRHKFLQSSILTNPVDTIAEIPCDIVDTWIRVRTASLVDVVKRNPSFIFQSMWEYIRSRRQTLQSSSFLEHRSSFVQVVHRTAHDFLLSTTTGNSLLKSSAEMESKIIEICFQTKLVCEVIFPGLQGLKIGPPYLVSALDCHTCKDEEVFAKFLQQGEDILEFLYHAGLVQPDKDMLSEYYCGTSDYPIRTAMPFPSSKNSEMDLGQIFLQAGRYTAVRLWLTERNVTKDSDYNLILLAPLIHRFMTDVYGLPLSSRALDNLGNNFWILLEFLVSHEADVHSTVASQSEERPIPLGEGSFPAELTGHEVTCSEKFSDAWRAANTYHTVRFTTSCYQSHLVWFRHFHHDDLSRGGRLQLWGDFYMTFFPPLRRLANANFAFDIDEDQDKAIELKENRISVLARSFPESEKPIMWAVSDADSHFLIEHLGQSEVTRFLPLGPDKYMLTPCRDDGGPGIFEEVRVRSPIVSFLGAMRHMGKSENTIQTFYEKEAARMALEPARHQEGWKQWFRGNDIVPTEFPSGASTELAET